MILHTQGVMVIVENTPVFLPLVDFVYAHWKVKDLKVRLKMLLHMADTQPESSLQQRQFGIT